MCQGVGMRVGDDWRRVGVADGCCGELERLETVPGAATNIDIL